MTTSPDHDLQQWIDVWQTEAGATAAPDAIRAHVRRRSRLLAIWLGGEIALCAGVLVFLLHRAATHPDPLEKLAMAVLALIAVCAAALSWWNWRGTVRASRATTTAFLAISMERVVRLRRAVLIGWGILAAEALVLAPWVWHQLYGGLRQPSTEAERFGWGLLAGMIALAILLLAGLHAWARREARILQSLQQEIGGQNW